MTQLVAYFKIVFVFLCFMFMFAYITSVSNCSYNMFIHRVAEEIILVVTSVCVRVSVRLSVCLSV